MKHHEYFKSYIHLAILKSWQAIPCLSGEWIIVYSFVFTIKQRLSDVITLVLLCHIVIFIRRKEEFQTITVFVRMKGFRGILGVSPPEIL